MQTDIRETAKSQPLLGPLDLPIPEVHGPLSLTVALILIEETLQHRGASRSMCQGERADSHSWSRRWHGPVWLVPPVAWRRGRSRASRARDAASAVIQPH